MLKAALFTISQPQLHCWFWLDVKVTRQRLIDFRKSTTSLAAQFQTGLLGRIPEGPANAQPEMHGREQTSASRLGIDFRPNAPKNK